MSKKIVATILLAAALTLTASADVPTLHHHTAPPVPELSCSDQLGTIRKELVRVSVNEALLFEAHHNRQASNFFLTRAHVSQHTKDLDVTYANCTPANVKVLNLVLAKWQYDYTTDMEALGGHE